MWGVEDDLGEYVREEQNPEWLTVCCLHKHNHAKDPNASDP